MSRHTPVIDRLETHASADESREWLRLLADLSLAWIEAETAVAIVGHAASRLAETLGIDLSIAYWLLPGGDLQLIHATGIPDEVLRGMPVGDSSAHAAALGRLPIDHGGADDQFALFLQESGRDAYVCYPLLSANHLTGTMSFGRRGPGFSTGERALLDIIANQLSIVLERWRLRAQQEEALAELRRRTAFKRRLLDCLPGSSLAVIDRSFVYGMVTSTGFHSGGHDAAWASGRPVSEVHDDDTARLLMRQYGGAFEGRNISFNLVWQKRHYTVTAAPLDRDSAGISTIVALAHDETERIEQERALAISEERYRLVVRALAGAIWDCDLTTGRVAATEEMSTVFGYPADDPELATDGVAWWTARIHPDDRERVLRHFNETLAGDGLEWREDYRLRRADGRYVQARDQATLVRDATGHAIRIAGATLDVSAEHAAAQREADRRARQERVLTTLETAAGAMVSGFEILRLTPATDEPEAARAKALLTRRLEQLARSVAEQLPNAK